MNGLFFQEVGRLLLLVIHKTPFGSLAGAELIFKGIHAFFAGAIQLRILGSNFILLFSQAI